MRENVRARNIHVGYSTRGSGAEDRGKRRGGAQGRAQGGAQRLSGVRLSWGEFQLVFGDSWHAMIVKRVFDIMDRDGDGVIAPEDLPLPLNPHLSPSPSPQP